MHRSEMVAKMLNILKSSLYFFERLIVVGSNKCVIFLGSSYLSRGNCIEPHLLRTRTEFERRGQRSPEMS